MGKKARVYVHVLKLDIQAGYRKNCEGCPLSLAIHRALGYPVYVYGTHIRECEGDPQKGTGRLLAMLPESARRFILDLDEKRPVAPFGFYLRLSSRDILRGESIGGEA